MKIDVKQIRKKRRFSEDFKRAVVKEYESGQFSVPELSRIYSLSTNVIYRWIYKFSIFNKKSARIVEMATSSTSKIKELEKKIKELERIVGSKQIKIDYLEKMIEIAKSELDIDIKKNYSTPHSSGSEKTKKK